jgi:hypothetical protein
LLLGTSSTNAVDRSLIEMQNERLVHVMVLVVRIKDLAPLVSTIQWGDRINLRHWGCPRTQKPPYARMSGRRPDW